MEQGTRCRLLRLATKTGTPARRRSRGPRLLLPPAAEPAKATIATIVQPGTRHMALSSKTRILSPLGLRTVTPTEPGLDVSSNIQ
jgi:hypothetical protein